jgi:hypothetical protein
VLITGNWLGNECYAIPEIRDDHRDIVDWPTPKMSAHASLRVKFTRSSFSLIPWVFDQSGYAIFQLFKLPGIQS